MVFIRNSTEILPAHCSLNFSNGQSGLNLQEIHADALEWLKRDNLLRELLIQSLRVTAQLGFMENGAVAERGQDILRTFGSEYPISPSPDSYEQLVQKAISTLSPDMQETIRSRFGLLH